MKQSGFNAKQFRDHVVRPVLKDLDMWSLTAERLVLGTVAVESDFGHYIVQNGGPAVGVVQIEPATAADILFRYLKLRKDIDKRFQSSFVFSNEPLVNWGSVPILRIADKIKTDLRFSVALCRLKYFMAKPALPAADDLDGIAQYWKTHYNTHLGRGTVSDFTEKYKRFGLVDLEKMQ